MAAEDIPWALREVRSRTQVYALFHRYWRGDHDLAFATDKFRTAFANVFRAFAMNMCKAVVAAPLDRLEIEAWQGTGAGDADRLWRLNRMELQADSVHLEAGRCGDGFVIVWPDPTGTPRIWPQDARHCAVRYDTETPGRVDLGAKIWGGDPDSGGRRYYRLTLYYLDVVEKWITRERHSALPDKADAFVPFLDPDGSEGGPILANPWETVPMFHFANGATVGQYGISLLEDVVPIQNALNKTVLDMMVGGEFVALPQRWATGVEDDDEDTDLTTAEGAYRRWRAGVERFVTTENEEAKFGEFGQADLTKFVSIIDMFKMTIAQMTGIPPHWLMLSGAEAPSGESLKTAEGRLVKMCQRMTRGFGSTWGDAMTLAIRQGGGAAGEDLEPVWSSVETRDDRAAAETQEIKQRVGVSKAQSLRELGYTDEEIEQMSAEKQADAEAFAAASLLAFDRAAPVEQGQGRNALNNNGG